MNKDAELLLDFLGDVLYDPKNATLDLDRLSPDFKELGEGIMFFAECMMEIRRFATDLSRGDLSTAVPSPENDWAAPLKSLHASLRHLTWQTQQVAKGDYQQSVEFMGEFASAFNSMVYQLERQHKTLLAELEHSNRTVEEERQQIKHLESYAYQDKLTSTHNRHYGMKVLDEWLIEKRSFCICFIDLDNLKYINDTYGHAEGDFYLIDVANHLKVIHPNAVVCRLGGDEFMVLVEGMDQQSVEERLYGVRSELYEEKRFPKLRSISYGVVEADEYNTQTASQLLGLADERMYRFKKAYKKERKSAITHQFP